MQQMELREMIADVRFADDIDAVLNNAQIILTQEYQELLTLMSAQILENSTATNTLACDNLRKLKFYQKLNIEVERLEDSLFDD